MGTGNRREAGVKRARPSTEARSGLVLLRAALALRSGAVKTLDEALSGALAEEGLSRAAFRRWALKSRGPLRALLSPPRTRKPRGRRTHPLE